MPVFTWTVPSPPGPPAPPSSSSSVVTPPGVLFGAFDQEVDPDSRDYVDTSDGAWAETASSRTAVMMQLEIRYGTWPADPEAGSRIADMLESGDPIEPIQIVDEVRRCLQLVVEDGIIADLSVEAGTFDAEAGRLDVEISYTDTSSGHTVELVYSPL